MPVASRSRRIAPAATRAAPDMIWPVASSMTAMVSRPPGRRMTSGATIAGRTSGSTTRATRSTISATPSETATTTSAWELEARRSVSSSTVPTASPRSPASRTPEPRGLEQHTERRRKEAVRADPLRARERRGKAGHAIDLSSDPCRGSRPGAGDADDSVDHVDLVKEDTTSRRLTPLGSAPRRSRRRTRGSMSGRRSPGPSACHWRRPGLQARREPDPRDIRCRSWRSRVRPSSPARPGPGPSPWSPSRCAVAGAGAGRLRISDQTNSPAASSTPMAMSRVGSEIVDVVIAGGTAGTGVTVGRRRGRGAVGGCGSRRRRGSRGRRLGGRGVGSRSSNVGVGVAAPVLGRRGGGARRLGRARPGPSSLSVQPLAAPGRAAARRLPPPRGRNRIRLATTAAAPVKPGRRWCAFAPRMCSRPLLVATTRRSPSRAASG